MYILAIDTTGPVGSVALIKTDTVVYGDCGADSENKQSSGDLTGSAVPVKITTTTMSHLKNLIPMVKELMDEQHVCGGDIAAVAASCGPGSFTGIRIGVSTARALAQAWDVPCISVPTLETFREKCGGYILEHGGIDLAGGEQNTDQGESASTDGEQNGEQKVCDGSVCVIFNARRGQVYGACYDKGGKVLIAPGPYMLTDVLNEIERLGISPVFYGDGVDAYFQSEEFAGRIAGYRIAPEEERYQTADMTARFALDKWNRGETIEYGELTPDYMRESEAEQRLKDGSLEKMRKEKLERLMKMAGKE